MKPAYFVFVAILWQLAAASPVSYYKPLTEEEAARLAAWTPEDQHMWQLSGQFEGDMVLTPSQRNGLVDRKFRWPNREIPYEISNDFTAAEKQFISNALTQEYAKTCITVRPKRPTDQDYVQITGQDGRGCVSHVGRLGGAQQLNLQRDGCVQHGVIVHEFLHAIGFQHQQSASDRDNYVTIMWQNIKPGMEHNFHKFASNVVSNFGQSYDYGSIMHYEKDAFSVNGQPTIVPHDPNAVIGQIKALSNIDIRKINAMYGC